MQVLVRSSTSARPRVASPGMPVSDSGMASLMTAYGRKSCALAMAGRANAAAVSHARVIWAVDLAKSFHRDGLVPGLRIVSFTTAHLARRIDRAGAGFDLGEQAILRLIETGLRERIAGRDRVVARARQPRDLRGDP